MSIENVGDLDEIKYKGHFRFNPASYLGHREAKDLKNYPAPYPIEFETILKKPFSFDKQDINPMMIRVSVRKKHRDGSEIEGTVTVDTRESEKPKAEPEKPRDDQK